jgi:hypothetical protein
VNEKGKAMNATLYVPDIGQYEAELRWRLRGRVADLSLQVHDDGLILQGWCATYYAKQVAQHAAMTLTGMPILANRIEVFRQSEWEGVGSQSPRSEAIMS